MAAMKWICHIICLGILVSYGSRFVLAYEELSGEADEDLKDLISSDVLEEALHKFLARQKEERLNFKSNNKSYASFESSQATHASFNRPSDEAIKLSELSEFLEVATQEILQHRAKPRLRRQGQRLLSNFSVNVPPPSCPSERQEAKCDPEFPFRTFSGFCNNIKQKRYGKHTIPFRRFLASDYDDGLSQPRGQGRFGPLPNVRLVSNEIHQKTSNSTNKRHTLMLMQWGQLLDHDLTLTPMIRGPRNIVLDCRDCSSNSKHRACYPILVPTGDEFFPHREPRSGDRQCIPFTRSLPGQISLGPREQLNQNTAFLDASYLYGSTPCRAKILREHQGGRMKKLDHPNSKVFKGLMPTSPENVECRSMLGDDRSNEQPGLTSMHTIILREHNRLADQLSAINPDWKDERVFQEARKIVMGINQHISFKEFLPRVLGQHLMNHFNLTISDRGFFTGYDSTCSPDIFNEFATAAFRFGHTLISPMFHMMNEAMKTLPQEVRLREHFNNPDVVYTAHFIDKLIRGLVMQPMENYDPVIAHDLTNRLFEEHGRKFTGMDLAAINIQRGRDHGIAGYTRYRKICQEKLGKRETIRRFSDLNRFMDPSVVDKLAKIYKSVHDIDLFTGGISEISVNGGLVGETFGCIIAEQFRKLKWCDRFWYETQDRTVGFTYPQLQEIRKVTLASLICKNCDVPAAMPRRVFDMHNDEDNEIIACKDQPTLDILQWQGSETDSLTRKGRTQSLQKVQSLPFCDFYGRIVLIGHQIRISACRECECLSSSINSEVESCKTVKVESCSSLEKEFGKDAVVNDPDCLEQCPLIS